MKSAAIQILTRPAAGPAFAALSLALAVALGFSLAESHRSRTILVERTLELSRALDAERSAAALQSASCPSAGAAQPDAIRIADRAPSPDAAAVAARLTAEPPAGFDGCARMESADQAVLATLR